MIVVFDMGATHTRVAASDNGQTIGEPIIFNTHQDFEAGITELVSQINAASGGHKIDLVYGGVASVLNSTRSEVVISRNLPKWIGHPLRQRLADSLGTTVALYNDAELIAMGEATFGAGMDKQIVGFITISTGIGGLRIVDGKIDRSAYGFEIGYQFISSDSNGRPVRMEDLVGGNALQKRYGKAPRELAQDSQIWENVIHNLAISIHNAIIFWSPELIILGGPMMKDIPLDRLHQETSQLLTAYPEPPEFRLAELGDKGGLLGALSLAASQKQ